MGQKLSQDMRLGWEDKMHPEIAPRNDRPPTFDPMYGFEKGRKVREMKATTAEMDRWEMPVWQRDYCAHKAIVLLECLEKRRPFGGWGCHHLRHDWDLCQLDDSIMRMKEFERERRLLKRMQRKKLAADKINMQ